MSPDSYRESFRRDTQRKLCNSFSLRFSFKYQDYEQIFRS